MSTVRDPDVSRSAALEAAERIRLIVPLLAEDDTLKIVFDEAQSILLRDGFCAQDSRMKRRFVQDHKNIQRRLVN